MAETTVRRRVRAAGRVQGVFFRDSTRREAQRRGVAGWVRNCADGSVEAVFEGPPEGVAHLVAWAHRGPAEAEVTAVDTVEERAEGLRGFEIR